MATERTYGCRPTPGIPGRATPPRPPRNVQSLKGGSYRVVDDNHRTIHTGPSLERARQVALVNSIGVGMAHVYRMDRAGRLNPTHPVLTYASGTLLQ